MAHMIRRQHCIGCGKVMPSRPTDKGWTVTQCSGKGKGQRWYRQCGCMSAVAYGVMVEDLFAAGRDYWRAAAQPNPNNPMTTTTW